MSPASLSRYRRTAIADFLPLTGLVAVCPPPAPSAKDRPRLQRLRRERPARFAMLNCTPPGRGKSQAIEHNSALPKIGQSLCRASLGGRPLRALRVRVMVCYVLRPSPDNGYFSSPCSVCLFRRFAQCGIDPPPALRSACGGSHCVARSRLGRLAPVRPGGAPCKAKATKVGAGETELDGLAAWWLC